MLAVWIEKGAVSVREAEAPPRAEGYATLRLICGGICNTDLELVRGYYGFAGVPGHEFVAEVEEASDRRLVGKRVVGEINLACGVCEWCRKGLGRHCPARTVLGIVRHPGAFQERFTLPERNLHVLPDSMPTEVAVFAEPVAAACEILDQTPIPKGATVAVLGDGKLGLLTAQVLAAAGCAVELYGRHPEKMRIVEPAGVRTQVAGEAPPAMAYDWVVEATGSAAGLRAAVAMTRPRGVLILKSTVHGLAELDAAAVVVHEITLVGSRCGRMEAALPLLASGQVRVREMISERLPLREAVRGFERAARRGALKVLLDATD
jgi:alcohol dehydrogenase